MVGIDAGPLLSNAYGLNWSAARDLLGSMQPGSARLYRISRQPIFPRRSVRRPGVAHAAPPGV